MSADHEQEFFADGVAEDVISALSRHPSLFVIARNCSFTYGCGAVDVEQVGREPGVRYLLEGSLRAPGPKYKAAFASAGACPRAGLQRAYSAAAWTSEYRTGGLHPR
jgi:hypothetical protein